MTSVERTHTTRDVRSTGSVLTLLLTALLLLPSHSDGAPLSLRFSGEANLIAFGGSATTPFRGSVTWDPLAGWVPVWEGCPDFCLDGSPGAVSATFELQSSYTERIQPHSRLMVMGWGALLLDLFFEPVIDLDAQGAPDVAYVGLSLSSEPPDFSIFEDGQLPLDLAFLGRLNDRFVQFSDDKWEGGTTVVVDTVSVVPEPPFIGLFATGLVGALGLRLHARRRSIARAM